jgi:hypothetical protein
MDSFTMIASTFSAETNNGNNSLTQEVTPEDKVQNEEHVNGNG